jgi:hypothetical protein
MRDIPDPILELTFEQQFEMAKLIKSIEESDREVMLKACKELLRYNFILKSTIGNLLHHWNDDLNFGDDNEGVNPS